MKWKCNITKLFFLSLLCSFSALSFYSFFLFFLSVLSHTTTTMQYVNVQTCHAFFLYSFCSFFLFLFYSFYSFFMQSIQVCNAFFLSILSYSVADRSRLKHGFGILATWVTYSSHPHVPLTSYTILILSEGHGCTCGL